MTELFPFQRQGVRAITRFNGRALLADEMGLGKSLQALTWFFEHRHRPPKDTIYRKHTGGASPCVIVCPAFLKYHWEREALNHYGLSSFVCDGRKPRRIPANTRIVIINYDILPFWLEEIRALCPQLLVLDEAHYVGNRKAKRTKAAKALSRRVLYILALTGSPFTNRPAELWTILNILMPKTFSSFYPFGVRYCGRKVTPWGVTYKGAAHMKELNRRLRQLCMIRRLKRDVLDQLPTKTRISVPFKLSRSAMKEYEHAERDFLGWVAVNSPEKLRGAQKAEGLARTGYLLRLIAELKMPQVLEWLQSALDETDGKVIAFGIHRARVKEVADHFGRASVMVTGKIRGMKRQHAVDQFQTRKDKRLFAANMDAAGLGLNLTAADTMAFFEFPWVPGKLTQAEARNHRIGQKKKTYCYYLVAIDTVEEILCDLLQKKQKTFDTAIDGAKSVMDLDIYDQFVRAVKRKVRDYVPKKQRKQKKKPSWNSRSFSKRTTSPFRWKGNTTTRERIGFR